MSCNSCWKYAIKDINTTYYTFNDIYWISYSH